MAAPTVVSAYYPIRSKFKPEKYVEWIAQFWPRMKCPLVFFTDVALVSQFEQLFLHRPGPTKVIGIPFNELAAFKKLSPEIWAQTYTQDHEHDKHSPELYAIWYEKKEFILRAIDLNPFSSEHFVWCDAGICRFPEWVSHLQSFPRREMFPPSGKMLVLRITPFDKDPHPQDKYGIRGDFTNSASVGGGILAADIAGWKLWSKAYDEMLMRFYLADRFIGKDQNIMGSIIVEKPDSVVLIDPPVVMNSLQRWFYLLFYLASVNVV
jgi:hypothetical protein